MQHLTVSCFNRQHLMLVVQSNDACLFPCCLCRDGAGEAERCAKAAGSSLEGFPACRRTCADKV